MYLQLPKKVSKPNMGEKYLTALARALRLLIPHSAALERFDKLRFTMKNVQENGKYKACNRIEYDKLSKHFMELVKALVHTNDLSNDLFKRIGKKPLMHEWKCVL